MEYNIGSLSIVLGFLEIVSSIVFVIYCIKMLFNFHDAYAGTKDNNLRLAYHYFIYTLIIAIVNLFLFRNLILWILVSIVKESCSIISFKYLNKIVQEVKDKDPNNLGESKITKGIKLVMVSVCMYALFMPILLLFPSSISSFLKFFLLLGFIITAVIFTTFAHLQIADGIIRFFHLNFQKQVSRDQPNEQTSQNQSYMQILQSIQNEKKDIKKEK